MQRISIRLNQDEALLMSAVLSSPAVAGIVPRDWGIHCQLGGACWARTLGLPAAVLILPAAVLIQAGPQRIPACLVCADYLTH